MTTGEITLLVVVALGFLALFFSQLRSAKREQIMAAEIAENNRKTDAIAAAVVANRTRFTGVADKLDAHLESLRTGPDGS